MDALLLRTEHRIAFLDVKGIEEGLEVLHGHVHAVHCQGVDVHVGETLLLLVCDVLGPDGAIAEVEALGTGEAVDHGILLAGHCVLHSGEGDGEAAVVADVFAKGESAISLYAGKDFNLVELGHQLVSQGIELGLVFRSPPVDHVAAGVEH